jgi:uncharacterized protein HemX
MWLTRHGFSREREFGIDLAPRRLWFDAQPLELQNSHLEVGKMKRILTVIAVLGLAGSGLSLSAQQATSAQSQSGATQQQQVDTQSQQSAQSFEGKIAKSGDKLVLQEASTQTAYQLDDQAKAKQFEGKDVKVTATMDSTTKTLHVVNITPSASR